MNKKQSNINQILTEFYASRAKPNVFFKYINNIPFYTPIDENIFSFVLFPTVKKKFV